MEHHFEDTIASFEIRLWFAEKGSLAGVFTDLPSIEGIRGGNTSLVGRTWLSREPIQTAKIHIGGG